MSTLHELHAGGKSEPLSDTVIAVAGGVGRGTAREMIHTVLGGRCTVVELCQDSSEASVARLCRPRIAAIAQVGDCPAGSAQVRQGWVEAELLAALPRDGVAILGDDPLLRRLARHCQAPIVWVGRSSRCHLTADDVTWSRGELRFVLGGCPFSVRVWGRHHLTSALIAVAVGRAAGLEFEEIAEALRGLDSVPAHCDVAEIRGATIICDAWAPTPESMRAALELLGEFDAAGRRVVVCDEMQHLGGEAPALHYQLGDQVVTLCGADLLIACGPYARDVLRGARAAGMPKVRAIGCRRGEEALPYLGQAVLPGDVALIQAGPSLGMTRVLEAFNAYPRRRAA